MTIQASDDDDDLTMGEFCDYLEKVGSATYGGMVFTYRGGVQLIDVDPETGHFTDWIPFNEHGREHG